MCFLKACERTVIRNALHLYCICMIFLIRPWGIHLALDPTLNFKEEYLSTFCTPGYQRGYIWFLVYKSKRSEMVLGKKNPILLFIILYGVFCDGIFDPKCSKATCQCGETVTITCNLTHPVEEIVFKYYDNPLLHSNLSTKEKMFTDDHKISIEWTEDKMKVIISKVKFSDKLKYSLILFAKGGAGNHQELIDIKVSGSCNPEITKNNETKELECEVESETKASIVWIDNHRMLYPATRTKEPEQLNTGFMLRSFLKWTEEIGDHHICCYVSYLRFGVYTENKLCVPNISALSAPSSTWSHTHLGIVIILVAVSGAVLFYLLRRKNNLKRTRISRKMKREHIQSERKNMITLDMSHEPNAK